MLGDGLEEFKKHIPDSSPIILLEFDTALLEYCKKKSPILHTFCCCSNEQQLQQHIEHLSETFALKEQYSIYYHKHAYQYSEKINTIEHLCKQIILQYWSNQATLKKMGYLWLRNSWKNIAFNTIQSMSAITQKQELQNLDVVITGAGPSLDRKHLTYLKKMQAQLCIITVDSALPTLQSYNIVPDFCIILESQWYNMFDFLPKPHAKTIAIADTSAYPPSIQSFSHKYFVTTHFAPLSFFTHYNKALPINIPALGSVGLLSVYIAFLLSFKRIYLIGMDFSYYLGKTHSVNSASYIRWLTQHSKTKQSDTLHAQLNNPSLRKISSSVPYRFNDAVLQRYTHNLDSLMYSLTKQYATPIFDLNHTYSMLNTVKKITLKEFDTDIHNNKANKNKDLYLTTLRKQASTAPQSTIIKNILSCEYKKYHYLQKRIQELQKQHALPTQDDWQTHGLDMCTYSLFFNAYQLRHSFHYWETHAIYTHVSIMIHRALHDLEKIIKSTNI